MEKKCPSYLHARHSVRFTNLKARQIVFYVPQSSASDLVLQKFPNRHVTWLMCAVRWVKENGTICTFIGHSNNSSLSIQKHNLYTLREIQESFCKKDLIFLIGDIKLSEKYNLVNIGKWAWKTMTALKIVTIPWCTKASLRLTGGNQEKWRELTNCDNLRD